MGRLLFKVLALVAAFGAAYVATLLAMKFLFGY